MESERGITLVEVLATLTILSIIGITIWQTFFSGYQFSQKSITKNMLQAEANLTIFTLTRIHQTEDQYTLKSAGCTITILDKNSIEIQKFSNSKYCYKISGQNDSLEINSKILVPGSLNSDLKILIRVSNIRDISNYAEVSTILYRLKDGEFYE